METTAHINQSGHLEVGDGHSIYWEDWGNPKSVPFLHMHGGPGGGFRDSHKLTFNPANHRVIFFDQRGSGKSTPFAETRNNTTQDLVQDIEKLRSHLSIDRFHLFGGSWGSTLSLVYSIAHPERVIDLILWGIYLGTQFENDIIAEGYARYNYPEAWERFINLVPDQHRVDGTSITKYYSEMMDSENSDLAQKYADEWSLWETSLLSINYNKQKLEDEIIGDASNLPLAKLETQYFLNNCYIEDDYILKSIDRIKHLPCHVIQGRFDNCTPPVSAYKLSKTYGTNLTLQFVNAGHLRSDPELFSALVATINEVSSK